MAFPGRPIRPALWRARPATFDPATASRGWLGFWAIGRLNGGVTVAQAQAEMAVIAGSLEEQHPGTNRGRTFPVLTLKEARTGSARGTVHVLLAAVIAVLLVARANVANLLLSRGSARAHEIAIRTALGASRARLVRQLLVESLLISSLAGLLGLALADLATGALLNLAPANLPRLEDIRMDAAVVSFAGLASMLTALLFGLIPAFSVTGGQLGDALREAGRSGTGSRRSNRALHAFVVAETALAVVLLSGAGLLLRSFWNLVQVEPGIQTRSILAVGLSFSPADYPDAASTTRALDRLVAEVGALPAVVSAGAVTDLPMSGAVNSTIVTRPGFPPPGVCSPASSSA